MFAYLIKSSRNVIDFHIISLTTHTMELKNTDTPNFPDTSDNKKLSAVLIRNAEIFELKSLFKTNGTEFV